MLVSCHRIGRDQRTLWHFERTIELPCATVKKNDPANTSDHADLVRRQVAHGMSFAKATAYSKRRPTVRDPFVV